MIERKKQMITIPDSITRHVLFIGGKEYGVFTYKSSKEDFLKYSFGLSKKEKEDISSDKTFFEYKDVTVNISKEEKELLEGLHKHGVENYNHHGWDYMVECWNTYEMILELLWQIRSYCGMIYAKHVSSYCGILFA